MAEFTNSDAAWARLKLAALLRRCCLTIASQYVLLADQVRA